ncbi:MAG TPA: VOC family protein, partial [Terriglobia bacterium]|nr:VOC family protein [Terriglobia bacterium]
EAPAPITKMAPLATAEVIPDRHVAAAAAQAESKPIPRRQPPPPAASEIETSEEAPAPITKMAPPATAEVIPEEPKHVVDTPSARHQVVWFDIPVRDLDRALRFYSAVLGTRLKKEQAGPGVAIAVLPHAEGSIGGSLVQTMDSKPSESGPLLYLNTNGRLDEALNAVESHGGKVLSAMHSIEPFGFRAIVLDSEGNRVALHSM